MFISYLLPSPANPYGTIIHTTVPATAIATTTVIIPAPARSPVVIGFGLFGSSSLWWSISVSVAFGLDSIVLGDCASKSIRLLVIPPRAAIWTSNPVGPTGSVEYHRSPQRFWSPPEHCFEIAAADPCSLGVISSLVEGTRIAVNANHIATYPLKQSWFRSHVRIGSQATSESTTPLPSFGKKVVNTEFRRPSTRLSHLSEPFVWYCQMISSPRKEW